MWLAAAGRVNPPGEPKISLYFQPTLNQESSKEIPKKLFFGGNGETNTMFFDNICVVFPIAISQFTILAT